MGDRKLLTPKIVQETTKVVQTDRMHLKQAHDRQKSWADKMCRPMEFEVNDQVYLKRGSTIQKRK